MSVFCWLEECEYVEHLYAAYKRNQEMNMAPRKTIEKPYGNIQIYQKSILLNAITMYLQTDPAGINDLIPKLECMLDDAYKCGRGDRSVELDEKFKKGYTEGKIAAAKNIEANVAAEYNKGYTHGYEALKSSFDLKNREIEKLKGLIKANGQIRDAHLALAEYRSKKNTEKIERLQASIEEMRIQIDGLQGIINRQVATIGKQQDTIREQASKMPTKGDLNAYRANFDKGYQKGREEAESCFEQRLQKEYSRGRRDQLETDTANAKNQSRAQVAAYREGMEEMRNVICKMVETCKIEVSTCAE